eukprot:2453148-Prymnesium_polylepis.1
MPPRALDAAPPPPPPGAPPAKYGNGGAGQPSGQRVGQREGQRRWRRARLWAQAACGRHPSQEGGAVVAGGVGRIQSRAHLSREP